MVMTAMLAMLLTTHDWRPWLVASKLPTQLYFPANDTSCHAGQGHIVGIKFCGKEIQTVNTDDFGLCCAACGVQVPTNPPSAKQCRWVMYDSETHGCVLSTGEGTVCGQKNSVTNSAHGPNRYKCNTSTSQCVENAKGKRR